MATQEEQNLVTKTRNEFVLSAETAIKEIKNQFLNFHSQLHQGEVNLIYTIEKNQADILQKYDEITLKLKEIQRCRDSVISILANNSNKQFLDAQLRTFTTEINEVIGKSDIDKLINLKWRCSDLQVDTICQITVRKFSEENRSIYSSFIYPSSIFSSSYSKGKVIPLLKVPDPIELERKRSNTTTDAFVKKSKF